MQGGGGIFHFDGEKALCVPALWGRRCGTRELIGFTFQERDRERPIEINKGHKYHDDSDFGAER